jgi:hypothetical protein
LAVGYKTNSKTAIDFRKWATKILKSYITEGYAVDKTKVTQNYDIFIEILDEIKFLIDNKNKQKSDLKPSFDYRQIYSTILMDHLGVTSGSTTAIFKKSFERLPIFLNSPLLPETGVKVILLDPAPNPAVGSVRIQYAVFESMKLEIALYNMVGEKVGSIFSGDVLNGTYSQLVDTRTFSAGNYLISLVSSSGARITKRLIIIN